MPLEPDDLVTITRHAKVAQVCYALASLGIPDALNERQGDAETIAADVGALPDRTARLLRATAATGVLDCVDGRYQLNAFSRQLCTRDEKSSRSMLLGWSLLRPGYVGLGYLDQIVREGGSGIRAAYGQPLHGYLDTHPDEAARYAEAMESTIEGFEKAAKAYDFSQHSTVVDVGGGLGGLLVAIIRVHPDVRGVLIDLPRVVAGAPAFLADYPECDRIEIVAGDLFTELPVDADAYIYSTVLRCFDDDDCVRAMKAAARAAAPGGRLLALEMVLPDGVPSVAAGLADLYAMAVYGGRDRTRADWAELAAQAGFAAPSFHPVDDTYAIVAADVARS